MEGEQDEEGGAGIIDKVFDIAKKRGRSVGTQEVVRSWPKKTRHLVNKQVILDAFEALVECGGGTLDAEGVFTANQ